MAAKITTNGFILNDIEDISVIFPTVLLISKTEDYKKRNVI